MKFGKREYLALSIYLAGLLALAAYGYVARPRYDLNGPPVLVQVDSTFLCIGPRFVYSEDLWSFRTTGKPVTAGHLYRRAVPLALFSEKLTGHTDEMYESGVAHSLDKKQLYPPDWINVSIVYQNAVRPRLTTPGDYLKSFEPDWTLDSGFRSLRRRQDCAGQSVQWGALSAITLDETCRDTTLKYGHPARPDVMLYCTATHCSTSNTLEHDRVQFEYTFPIRYLPTWPQLHTDLTSKLGEWRADRQCVPK
jgi:hypothetical protein